MDTSNWTQNYTSAVLPHLPFTAETHLRQPICDMFVVAKGNLLRVRASDGGHVSFMWLTKVFDSALVAKQIWDNAVLMPDAPDSDTHEVWKSEGSEPDHWVVFYQFSKAHFRGRSVKVAVDSFYEICVLAATPQPHPFEGLPTRRIACRWWGDRNDPTDLPHTFKVHHDPMNFVMEFKSSKSTRQQM